MEVKYFWQDMRGNVYGPFRMDEEGNPLAGDVVSITGCYEISAPKLWDQS